MKAMWTCTALALALGGPPAMAQEKAPEKTETAAPRKPLTPLKILLVLSKFHGDAKVLSLPYTLPCNADDRLPGMLSLTGAGLTNQLRMGVEVPVLTNAKEGPPVYQYRNVGTNIDYRASALEDGRFRLDITVEHSSIYPPPEDTTRAAAGNAPLFRTFRTGFVPILRDGQTLQYTVATDPISGDVMKIDVTLTALK